MPSRCHGFHWMDSLMKSQPHSNVIPKISISFNRVPDGLCLHCLTHLALLTSRVREQHANQLTIWPLVICYGVALQRKVNAPSVLGVVLEIRQCLSDFNIPLLVRP